MTGHKPRPGRNHRRLVPRLPVTALMGAVVFAVFLSGCGPVRGSGFISELQLRCAVEWQQGPTEQGPSRVAATVPAGKRPSGVAVDPSTHTVYVTNRDDGTVVIERRYRFGAVVPEPLSEYGHLAVLPTGTFGAKAVYLRPDDSTRIFGRRTRTQRAPDPISG